MFGTSYGTRIDLRDLTDFDTNNVPVTNTIKGDRVILPESGMFGPEQPQPVQQREQSPMIPLQLPMQLPESECVKNARHCETCPICSKLYNDSTTYHNYAILFLLVVCIFLIKNLYSYHNRE
jgi:hypothetical protein